LKILESRLFPLIKSKLEGHYPKPSTMAFA
jgi:hypothetical protein